MEAWGDEIRAIDQGAKRNSRSIRANDRGRSQDEKPVRITMSKPYIEDEDPDL